MSNKTKSAIYLESKNGWFWVEDVGQRSIYYGPYRTQAVAEIYQTDIDTYQWVSSQKRIGGL